MKSTPLLTLGVAIVLSFGLWPAAVKAATLTMTPAADTYISGQTFTATVYIDTAGQAINSSQATIIFPPDMLEFKSIDQTGSIFSFWTEPPAGSNTTGQIHYAGGLPSPGFTGANGKLFSITFAARTVLGKATVRITEATVLANGDDGSNVLTNQGGATYTIESSQGAPIRPVPTVISLTHPDERAWYQSAEVVMSWNQPPGLLGVSYLFDQQPDTNPDDGLEPSEPAAIFTMPGEGKWYFHLRARYSSGWSATTHYRLQHDSIGPSPFTIELVRDRGATDPSPELKFSTTDQTSGIFRYTIKIDDQTDVQDVISPYTLNIIHSGTHQIVIVAYDRAGNSIDSRLEFKAEGYPPPVLYFVSPSVILLEAVVVKGTAAPGDTINVYVDAESVGQTKLGEVPSTGVDVRVPWTIISHQVILPGRHRVTATATGLDGQVSVATDPVTTVVSGQTISFGGRKVAVIAAVPAVAGLVFTFLALNIALLIRLLFSVRHLHRREVVADRELVNLRWRLRQDRMTPQQIDTSLEAIDQDLSRRKPRPPAGKRRRS